MSIHPADLWLAIRSLLPAVYQVIRGLPSLCVFAVAVTTACDEAPAALQVLFDMDPVIACRDVTPDDFRTANPDERLLEASLQISSLLRGGSESDLIEMFYRFESLDQSIRIADYSPRTTLEGRTAGNVSIENKREGTNHAGLAITAPFEWPVKVSGSGDIGEKGSHTVRYELAPKMLPVAASGTIRHGYGVFFKLKPSRGASLEGAKPFTLILRVPIQWRGGSLRLVCRATGIQRSVVRSLDETQVCGSRLFNLALFLDGDGEAKSAAEALAKAEQQLLVSISANRREIERRFYPTIVHKVGSLLDVVKPPVPEDWTAQILYGGDNAQIETISPHMPLPVQRAMSKYAIARREFRGLSVQ